MSQVEAALNAVREAIDSAYRAYTPVVYPGRIVCFVNSERILLKFNIWSEFAAEGLEVYELPGTPQTSMQEASARTLAGRLQSGLDRSQKAGSPG